MSRKLPLAERALAMGRDCLQFGQDQKALRILGNLARFRDLPSDLAEDIQVLMAETCLRCQKYTQARRYLQAALARRPDCARWHHLLAMAIDQDEAGNPRRALHHYARAVELELSEPEYRCDYGLCLSEMDQIEKGLEQLEIAVELAPDDPRYLRQLMLSLVDAGRIDRARQVVLFALFRNPHDEQLRQLWNELRFQRARLKQERDEPRAATPRNGPMLLPFAPKLKLAKARVREDRDQVVRLDPPTPPRPPHGGKRRQTR